RVLFRSHNKGCTSSSVQQLPSFLEHQKDKQARSWNTLYTGKYLQNELLRCCLWRSHRLDKHWHKQDLRNACTPVQSSEQNGACLHSSHGSWFPGHLSHILHKQSHRHGIRCSAACPQKIPYQG